MEEPVINSSQVQQEVPQTQGYRNPAVSEEDASPETLGGFVGMLILSMIPVVNLVMFLVWGFGSHNVNRKNFGRAALIVYAIMIVLCVIFSAAIIAFMASFFQSVGGIY